MAATGPTQRPTEPEPEIVLYDLACTAGVCFSPVVWRVRLMLNYKRVPYRTVFLEFPDIEPTLKQLGVTLPDPPALPGGSRTAGNNKYTVPTIHHVPTDTFLMDSAAIAPFLESTYPHPPVVLHSELGGEVERKAKSASAVQAFGVSLMPREVNVLPPRAQEFFRRTREASIGKKLEDLLSDPPGNEERAWAAAADDMRAASELMQTNKDEGPFVLGARPSWIDYFIAGNLQCARVVHEPAFERIVAYPGYRQIYEACQPWMEKKD